MALPLAFQSTPSFSFILRCATEDVAAFILLRHYRLLSRHGSAFIFAIFIFFRLPLSLPSLPFIGIVSHAAFTLVSPLVAAVFFRRLHITIYAIVDDYAPARDGHFSPYADLLPPRYAI